MAAETILCTFDDGEQVEMTPEEVEEWTAHLAELRRFAEWFETCTGIKWETYEQLLRAFSTREGRRGRETRELLGAVAMLGS
jgi:hypothetical protein